MKRKHHTHTPPRPRPPPSNIIPPGSYRNDFHAFDFATAAWAPVPSCGKASLADGCLVLSSYTLVSIRLLAHPRVGCLVSRVGCLCALRCDQAEDTDMYANCQTPQTTPKHTHSPNPPSPPASPNINQSNPPYHTKPHSLTRPPPPPPPPPHQRTPQVPKPRYRATCCVKGGLLLCFGGHDGTRHLNDVNTYDFATHRWATLEAVSPSVS